MIETILDTIMLVVFFGFAWFVGVALHHEMGLELRGAMIWPVLWAIAPFFLLFERLSGRST